MRYPLRIEIVSHHLMVGNKGHFFAVFVLLPEEGNGTYHLYPILEWNCLMSKVFTLDFITFLFVSQLCYSACVQLRVDNFQDPPARSATQPFNSLLIHVILVIYV